MKKRGCSAQIYFISASAAQISADLFAAGVIFLDGGNYDVVHDHQEFAGGWHFLAGIGHLPPIRVVHVHNPILGYKWNYGVTIARRLTGAAGWFLVDRLATHVCGTSRKALAAHGYAPGQSARPRVSVIHCGFNVGKFNAPRDIDRQSVLAEFGWPADAKIVLSVGRVDRALQFDHPQNHKNTWFALHVVRKAAERDRSVRYLIAGAGGARSDFESNISQWGLQDQIRLCGLRDDVPRLMRAADVLLFPSADEGLGMAAVEAQAAGLPVLASTAVPDEAIVVHELYTALSLQAPVELWANTLIDIVRMPRPTLAMCRRLLEASCFSVESSARNLVEIYSATPV